MIATSTFQEVLIPEGCYIVELSNSEGDPDVSIARAQVEPGVKTAWHVLHGTVERYVILSGHGSVEIGQLESQKVAAGDVVLIPSGCRQRISNTGQQDLVFLAICSPRFQPDAYEAASPRNLPPG